MAMVNFPAIWHIFWPFCTFSPGLVHFTRFGMLYKEKSGNLDYHGVGGQGNPVDWQQMKRPK
jgi:hypothetical protein